MRVHAFKASLSVSVSGGASAPLPVVLTYRVARSGGVDIVTAQILGEAAPIWLLRRIENDAGLIVQLLAKAAEDVAYDAARSAPVQLARAA